MTSPKQLLGSIKRIAQAKTDDAAGRAVERECRTLGVTPKELHDAIGILIEGVGAQEKRRPDPGELERRGGATGWSVATKPAFTVLSAAEARRLMNP